MNRTPETAVDLEPLGLAYDGPSVVAIGGGHGLAQVLEAAMSYAGSITGLVTVADDGGSSGRLTTAIDIPPPGDVRRCLLALSPHPSIFHELFAYRFTDTDVRGHSLGNLILAALTGLMGGDFQAAVRIAGEQLGALGRVLPISQRSLHLQAVIDGRVIDGQRTIAVTRGHCELLRLVPDDEPASPEALDAIAAADQIVIGPGSLYTSVISALLVPGVVPALRACGAKLVYVLNLVTQDGETLGMTGLRHVEAIAELAGLEGPGTIVVQGSGLRVPDTAQRVELTAEEAERHGWALLEADVWDRTAAWPQHDGIRLGRVLATLV